MRNKTEKRRNNIMVLGMITIFAVILIAFCVKGTVVSQGEIDVRNLEIYYREQEKVLLAETKEYLTDAGFQNSGVTLTRTVDEEGAREYTFTIHHRKIDRMEEAGRRELAEELSKIAVMEGDCKFYHEFLMYD